MSLFKSIKKAVQRIPQEARNLTNSVVRTGTAVGAAPFQILGATATQGIQAVAPAIGAASGVLRENPELAGLLGGATGLPLGGLFGNGAGAAGESSYALPTTDKPGVPMWVWIVGAGAALLGLVLILRRKA